MFQSQSTVCVVLCGYKLFFFVFGKILRMAPHTNSATPEQINVLLNFLDEHRDMARGRLRSIEGKVLAKRLWDELCNTLNSMGGCTKTVQQWQKVWFDRKHLAKKAAADSRRSASATGGGPSTTPTLSQWELKVLSIMGEGFGGRQTGARVPAFDMTTETAEPTPSTSSQISLPSFYLTEEIEIGNVDTLPTEVVETTQVSEPARQPVTQESLSSRTSSQTRTTRRRHAVTGSTISSKLIRFEEERKDREEVRNTELAGIRAALVQLCGLIREYLDEIKK